MWLRRRGECRGFLYDKNQTVMGRGKKLENALSAAASARTWVTVGDAILLGSFDVSTKLLRSGGVIGSWVLVQESSPINQAIL